MPGEQRDALTHPERLPYEPRRWDPVAAGALTFEPLDEERFPLFRVGVHAGVAGGTAPAVFNAANEVAVARFLAGSLDFPGVAAAVAAALDAWPGGSAGSLDEVLAADHWARRTAERFVPRMAPC